MPGHLMIAVGDVFEIGFNGRVHLLGSVRRVADPVDAGVRSQ